MAVGVTRAKCAAAQEGVSPFEGPHLQSSLNDTPRDKDKQVKYRDSPVLAHEDVLRYSGGEIISLGVLDDSGLVLFQKNGFF